MQGTAHSHWITLTHKATDNELLKGSLTKLKPLKPRPPTDFNDYAWFWNHLKNNAKCRNDYEHSKPTQYQNPAWKPGHHDVERYYEIKEWRCDCYHKKLAEHDAAVKTYEANLAEWEKL